MKSEVFNMDCLLAMRQMSDKQFDLAIVDPPYGLNVGEYDYFAFSGGVRAMKGIRNDQKDWDSLRPTAEYWAELFRVSVNQIVWGANYFSEHLPQSRGWLTWDKKHPDTISFSQFELAWTSFDSICKTFRMYPTHVAQGVKHHPTQKPVALYKWLLTNYAKPRQSILDTHLGSGSSRIAAYDLGFDFTGYELDTDYFDAQEQRFANHIAQPKLFEAPTPVQLTLEAAA